MVIQTKHFAELSDLVGLQCTCGHKDCNAVLTTSLSKDAIAGTLGACPSCQKPWLQQGDIYFGTDVEELIAALETVKALHKKVKVKFSFEMAANITTK